MGKGGIFLSTILIVMIVSVFVVLAVLGLSILTINKGYSYKHTIDPPKEKALPESSEDK